MITVSLLGCDRYVALDVVRSVHPKLADIYESKMDEIIFYAPESFLVHGGVEQTSYQLCIVVNAPHRFMPLEKNVAKFLSKAFTNCSVHVNIRFSYFDPDHEYNYIDFDYPRFMTEDNTVRFSDDGEDRPDDEEFVEPFLGNAFENIDNGDIEVEEDSDCQGEHNCSCGHKHS